LSRGKFDELRLTGALPSPSGIGLRILEITKDDDYDQADLERTIMGDPALSGQILKLANSALNDTTNPCNSVPQAALRLGSSAVRNVALGFTLIADNRVGEAESFDYDLYWSRALARAVVASALGNELPGLSGAEAFTLALLSDVGVLALASVHPERYSALIDGCPGADGSQLAELEAQAFDIDHFEVGAALLADWGLPRSFQRTILVYEGETVLDAADEGGVARLAALLRASGAVAEVFLTPANNTDPGWVRAVTRLQHVAEDLGLEHNRLLAIADGALPAWHEWGRTLGVPSSNCPPPSQSVERISAAGSSSPPAPELAPVANVAQLRRAIAPPDLDTVSQVRGEERDQTPTRILLVDDDVRMLKLIAHKLRKEGYEISTADSSEEGLKMALDLRPQLVITDWMMPGMTGIKLCETLRESEAGRKMYVLIVTAREDDEQVVEAFAAGADDYIVKPFNPRILLARVRAGQRMVRMRERVEAAERVRLRQLAELGILTRKLRAAAMTDALTELPNRRYAMKRLKQEWDSSLRVGRPLSLVMADIDHFKLVNDNHGHDAGDAVLKEVATTLQAMGRSGDILCRLGGEEFLSINVACTETEAAQGAERLRRAIEDHEFEHPSFGGRVTVSFGIAERTADMTCIDDLIKAADEALYAAKEAGRNCVRCWGDDAADRRSA